MHKSFCFFTFTVTLSSSGDYWVKNGEFVPYDNCVKTVLLARWKAIADVDLTSMVSDIHRLVILVFGIVEESFRSVVDFCLHCITWKEFFGTLSKRFKRWFTRCGRIFQLGFWYDFIVHYVPAHAAIFLRVKTKQLRDIFYMLKLPRHIRR